MIVHSIWHIKQNSSLNFLYNRQHHVVRHIIDTHAKESSKHSSVSERVIIYIFFSLCETTVGVEKHKKPFKV